MLLYLPELRNTASIAHPKGGLKNGLEVIADNAALSAVTDFGRGITVVRSGSQWLLGDGMIGEPIF